MPWRAVQAVHGLGRQRTLAHTYMAALAAKAGLPLARDFGIARHPARLLPIGGRSPMMADRCVHAGVDNDPPSSSEPPLITRDISQ
jgi:hypothetical protein